MTTPLLVAAPACEVAKEVPCGIRICHSSSDTGGAVGSDTPSDPSKEDDSTATDTVREPKCLMGGKASPPADDFGEPACLCSFGVELPAGEVKVVINGWPSTPPDGDEDNWEYSPADLAAAKADVPKGGVLYQPTSSGYANHGGSVNFPVEPQDIERQRRGAWRFVPDPFGGADRAGTVDLYLSDETHAGTEVGGCGDYAFNEGPIMYYGPPTSDEWSIRSLPAIVSVLGTETAQACSGTSSGSLDARVVPFPGWSHRILLKDGGPGKLRGATFSRVEVLDFAGASEIVFGLLGQEFVLTPAQPELDLPVAMDVGINRWTVTGGTSAQFPRVRLTTACSGPPDAIPGPVGYGVSVADLTATASALVGAGNLGEFMSITSNDARKTLAARIVNEETNPVLRLEVLGRATHLDVPLTRTGPSSWSWHLVGYGVDATGTLARGAQHLTASVSGGTVDLGSGPIGLSAASLTVTPLAVE